MRLEELKDIVFTKEAEYKLLNEQLDSLRINCASVKSYIAELIEARNIITEASRITQEQFKEFVEQLTTLAIQSVFPDKDYRFIVDFTLQSNRSMIELLVQQGDKEPYVPEDEQGGALLDIISFVLRVILWSLERPRSRNVIVLDEPFRFCGDLTSLAASFMKEISHKLKIQVIMVTHNRDLVEIADRCWEVTRNIDGVSIVNLLGS
jgi:chromosome segregation ATPase